MVESVRLADEWNHSLKGDYLWSNTNFGEAVANVMTPLTWSVIRSALDDWRFLPGCETIGNIGGRLYLNISIFATLFHGMGKQRQDLMQELESTLYLRLPEDADIPMLPSPRRKFLSALPLLARLPVKMSRGARELPAYLDANLVWFERTREQIRTASPDALRSLWRQKIWPHVKQGVWCTFGSVERSTDYTLHLRQDLTALVGPQDAGLLIANLSGSGASLASLGLVAGLAKVASGEMNRADYLKEFGHRGPDEFELSVPRPVEDPAWFERELARFQAAPVDVDILLDEQRRSFHAAWSRLQTAHPGKAARLQRRMEESARRARQRELARSAYVRDRWSTRLFALRAGELTGLQNDIFFLTLEEILDLLAGEKAAVHLIPERKQMYQQYRSLPAYPPVIRGHFDPFAWAADPQRRTDFFGARSIQPAAKPAASGILTGSPGSAGLAEGRVRVLKSPDEGRQLQKGEILVAVQTDVAWTLLFPLAAAVVTDVGAPLSHAAIVARELGIPAVVGCGNATMLLKTGDLVRVDGSRGTVTILERGGRPQ